MNDSELIGWLKTLVENQQKTLERQSQIIQSLLAGDDDEPAAPGFLDPQDSRR